MNSAPQEHAGSASGINNAISRVAGLLAIAVLGIVVVTATRGALPASARNALGTQSLVTGHAAQPALRHAVEHAYVAGFRDAMLVCALLAWTSAATAGLLLPRKR